MEEEAELIRVSGVVQGVGFRPFVWRAAQRLGLRGSVRNRGDEVEIVVAGPSAARAALVREIRQGPPQAVVRDLVRVPAALPEGAGFVIADSAHGNISTGIAPDLATCPACRAEIRTPGARRAGYAFTNCTDCGPRFSIVTGLPYDRQHTTMAGFSMCAACRAEYDNPADRRFHAQPVACPACGPRLRFVMPGEGNASDSLDSAVAVLSRGGIIALKGIGGYHLACLATSDDAVRTLRTRKARPAKPLAVMMGSAAMVMDFCAPTAVELALLRDPAAPVVPLAMRAREAGRPALSAGLAPGLDRVGVMLAYTPLHDLLLERVGLPLVMTSGNRSGCPQVIDEASAYTDLAGIADGWLVHDRPIARRLDDSVMAVCAGAGRVIRRGRGLAPASLPLPPDMAPAPAVLALGADLKAAFCLAGNGQALLSAHIGNLDDPGVQDEFRAALADYRNLFAHRPAVIAVDAHPDYHSHALGRQLAREAGLSLLPVWHHHAHVAACMVEHGVGVTSGPVVGIALDGVGLGQDGTAWGGEILLCDYRDCQRVGGLAPVAMPGGDVASREPWRMLLAHLDAALGVEGTDAAHHHVPIAALEQRPVAVMRAMVRTGMNAPRGSSAGRLFDAMAALLDVAPARLSYEGEAAMRLEALARQAPAGDDALPFGLQDEGVTVRIDPAPMWRAALRLRAAGTPAAHIAAAFHRGLATACADVARQVARRHGVETIALSGGVMHNAMLVEALEMRLRMAGLHVLLPRLAPAGDGGIALGQAAIAAVRYMEST